MPRTIQEVFWWHIDGIASALDELQDAGFTFQREDGRWYWENRSLHRLGQRDGYATLGAALRDAVMECYILPFQR